MDITTQFMKVDVVAKSTRDISRGYSVYDHSRKLALQILRPWLDDGILACGCYGL